MGLAADFYLDLQERIDSARKEHMPFRATVTAVSGSKVKIKPVGSDASLNEFYSRLDGPALNVNDDVIVMYVGGKPFVLGRIA